MSISSGFLSTSIGVSSKTIKKELQILETIVKAYGAHIISKTGIGYALKIDDYDLFSEFFHYNNDNNKLLINQPFIYQRAHYIIRRILSAKSSITINQLAEELYTSRTTINSDLTLAKSILSTYDIKIISKPHHGLTYEGRENNVRSCLICEYTNFEKNNLFVDEADFEKQFKVSNEINSKLREIIYSIQRDVEYLEISYQNITLLIRIILISFHRANYSESTMYDDEMLHLIKIKTSFKISKEILKCAGDLLHHEFQINDICLLTLHIICYRNYSTEEGIYNKNLYYEHFRYAEDIINFLCTNNRFLLIDGDSTLITSLALHLIPMMNRYTHNIKLPEIDMINIKQNSISSIELAVQSALYLKYKYHIEIPENEVCFLAYVFHPTFGRYNKNVKKKNIILVNSVDKSVGKGLAERLRRNFAERIGIIKLADYYELKNIDFKQYDLIVSDLEKESLDDIPLPILQIDAFFKQGIKSDIKDILSMKRFNFEIMINNFKREVFFVHKGIANKEDFFVSFYKEISEVYSVNINYYDELIERDNTCSIETGNKVAFMKTIGNYEHESYISVNILDKAILWNFETVQIVVIVHFNHNDEVNNGFFENGYLGNVIKATFFNQNNIMKLLRYQNYETLLNLIKNRVELPYLIYSKNKAD